MYWDILDHKRFSLLRKIVKKTDIGEYYMAGGTALSLQLGLRKSVDFDFFVPHRFNPYSLHAQLLEISPNDTTVVRIDGRGTCDVLLEGVQVSFFEYPYDLLCEYVCDKEVPELKMAGIRDIAAMKALAIGGRGSKKDFFDLYQIFYRTDYDMHRLVTDLYLKYGERTDFSYIGMGMDYFEEAEQEKLSEVLVRYDWEEIKKFFSAGQQEFFREMYVRGHAPDR